MIIHDVEQLSEEWFALRAGKMTSSIASCLLTPTGRPSTTYRREIGRIIAESMGLQDPDRSIDTEWMSRGREKEAEARSWFTCETNIHTVQVGFIEDDSGLLGCSPDALVSVCGDIYTPACPVEIKVPKPGTHIQWLLDDELPGEHKAQVHFDMALMQSTNAWFVSYCEYLQPLIIRVAADDYTAAMKERIEFYKKEFASTYERIAGKAL